MWARKVWTRWIAFLQWFRDSETILFARVQLLAGTIWTVLVASDLSPLFTSPKIMAGWLIFSGVVTEFARRQREEREVEGETKLPKEVKGKTKGKTYE